MRLTGIPVVTRRAKSRGKAGSCCVSHPHVRQPRTRRAATCPPCVPSAPPC